MKIFSTISMFCCVLKSSGCHILYSTYILRKYLVWEVWEAFNFPCRLWRWDSMAREKWLDRKTQVCSSEFPRNPDTHSQIGLKSENPGIFVLLWGGRKRNFLLSKGVTSVLNGSGLDRAQINVPHLKILQGWRRSRVVWWLLDLCLVQSSISRTDRYYQKGSAAQ